MINEPWLYNFVWVTYTVVTQSWLQLQLWRAVTSKLHAFDLFTPDSPSLTDALFHSPTDLIYYPYEHF